MAKPKLHLDEDASKASLERALLELGHDVTRTPNEWIQRSASDEEQLHGASAKGRSIFSFNIRDFIQLAKRIPRHAGIIPLATTSDAKIDQSPGSFFQRNDC